MDQTPATWSSSRRALSLGFGAIAVLVVGGIGWSVFASISGAVIVSGWVASESRNQVVEHIDGGTVSAVLVRDGDTVAAGEVLLRFDNVLPRSAEAILRAQYAELVAQRNRLEAEFRSADGVVCGCGAGRPGDGGFRSRGDPVRTGAVVPGAHRCPHRRGGAAARADRAGAAGDSGPAGARGVTGATGRADRRGAHGKAQTLRPGRGRSQRCAGAGARRENPARIGGRQRGRDRTHQGTDSGTRDPDSADRCHAHRGGGGTRARGAGEGERGAGTTRFGTRASGSPRGARPGRGRGVRHDGVRGARGGASG